MYNHPYNQIHNPEASAKFIEAGGLKSWGCFAVFLGALVLVLLFVLVHALLIHLLADPVAWWASLLLLSVVGLGVASLWLRRRRGKKRIQENL